MHCCVRMFHCYSGNAQGLMFICDFVQELKVRADLRHLSVCSVDPPGCTDIDDALHCRELENGNLEVCVKYFER